MLTFHSEDTKKCGAMTELDGGQLVSPYECPERVDIVLGRVRDVGLGEIRAQQTYGLDSVLAVHDRGYVEFLGRVWDDWVAAGLTGEVNPHIWPGRRMRRSAHGVPVFSGFCGGDRSRRGGRLQCQLPVAQRYGVCPLGADAGGGGRPHLRLRAGIADCVAGLDTFEGDPISSFKLKSADFVDVGRRLARFGMPTVFLLEGGYAVAEIGVNAVNVLSGFEGG